MDPPIASPSSIPIYLINGVGTVWDAQVAATLHCVHGISGLRVGTLPGVASQNGFLGLPLTLMQEETAYLVREGIAHLVPINKPTLPSPAEVDKYNATRLAKIRTQEAALLAQEREKNKMSKEKFVQAGQAAQAKREARARARAEKAGLKGELFEPEIPTKIEEPPAQRGNHFHAVQPHAPFTHLAHSEPITTLPHPLFPFPSSSRDRALLATYTRLSQLGLRVGLGPRFGGEYLIYPGDYLRYHAHFTSQVLVGDEVIRPAEIVAWGRLGTGTKKAGLLCCYDEDQEEVEFYSLEWANFG